MNGSSEDAIWQAVRLSFSDILKQEPFIFLKPLDKSVLREWKFEDGLTAQSSGDNTSGTGTFTYDVFASWKHDSRGMPTVWISFDPDRNPFTWESVYRLPIAVGKSDISLEV